MITAITLLRRKPGLTTREFQSYWKTRHAAVIETLPGIDRYTQSHPLHDQPEDAEPAWDGIAELWAKDSQSFRDIGASDAYRLVLKDEENFLDRDATALVLTDALLRREGQAAADGVKYVRFLKRRPGFAPEDRSSMRCRPSGATSSTMHASGATREAGSLPSTASMQPGSPT
jgi:uncharacterized protein (TIGR02118 family)